MRFPWKKAKKELADLHLREARIEAKMTKETLLRAKKRGVSYIE